MTPTELIERVSESFPILYHNDPEQLRNLCRNAFGVYQDKAGVLLKVQTTEEETELAIPPGFLTVSMISDGQGQYHRYNVESDKIVIYPQSKTVYPFSVEYFSELRSFDIALTLEPWRADTADYYAGDSAVITSTGEKFFCISDHVTAVDDIEPTKVNDGYDAALWRSYNEIPKSAIRLLFDYLEVLIEIPNTERAKGVNSSTGLQVEYPSREELLARKTAIELEMEETQAIIPCVSVRG